MCTVVISFEPGERAPLLLLGARDEFTDRPWLPPARHWPGSPLVGGLDEQAGGTWLAVQPELPRVSCLLNGRGAAADPAVRRSRGELPLRAAADGPEVLKELAADAAVLARYDPFHLVCADLGSVLLLSWDGEHAAAVDLAPGTHVLTNPSRWHEPSHRRTPARHTDPAAPAPPAAPPPTAPASAAPAPAASAPTDPKAARFGPRFAASRPSGDPALPAARAWGEWLTLAAGDGLDPADPRAIVARRDLPDGRMWGTTSMTLVALADDGLRYDFQPRPGGVTGWYPVVVL